MDLEHKTTTIRGDQINNSRSDGHSGSLHLQLYATDTAYGGQAISGLVLYDELLDPLNGGWYYHDVSGAKKFDADLARGSSHFITLVLLEHQNGDDYIVSWAAFPGQLIVPEKKSWWKFW